MALTWLPKIKGSLTCLLCALWLPLIPFMLYYGNRILISWAGMLLWLSLWGIMLTIINANYTHELVNALTNSAPTTAGTTGLTFGNRYAIWTTASETLAGMGLVVSWVIPLSGVLMGWISTKGFGAAGGATQVAEQAIERSTRGVGSAISTEGAANMFERNYEAIATANRPGVTASASKYNVSQKFGRAMIFEEHGYQKISGKNQAEFLMQNTNATMTVDGVDAYSKEAVDLAIASGLVRAGFDPQTQAEFQSGWAGKAIKMNLGQEYQESRVAGFQAAVDRASSDELSAQEKFQENMGMSINTMRSLSSEHSNTDLFSMRQEEFRQVGEALQTGRSDGRTESDTSSDTAGSALQRQIGGNIPVVGGASRKRTSAESHSKNVADNQSIETKESLNSSSGHSDKEQAGTDVRDQTKDIGKKDFSEKIDKAYSAMQAFKKAVSRKESLTDKLEQAKREMDSAGISTSIDVSKKAAGFIIKSGKLNHLGINEGNVGRFSEFAERAGKEIGAIYDSDQARRELFNEMFASEHPELASIIVNKGSLTGNTKTLEYSEGLSELDPDKNPELYSVFTERDFIGKYSDLKTKLNNVADGYFSGLNAGERDLHNKIASLMNSGKATTETIQQVVNMRSRDISRDRAEAVAGQSLIQANIGSRLRLLSGMNPEHYKGKGITDANAWMQFVIDIAESFGHVIDDGASAIQGNEITEDGNLWVRQKVEMAQGFYKRLLGGDSSNAKLFPSPTVMVALF